MQSFQIIKPVPVLSPYIRHYWILQDDAAVSVSERTFPIGCMQLVFHKGKQLFLQNDLKLQPQSFICGQSIGFSDVLSTGRIETVAATLNHSAGRVVSLYEKQVAYNRWAKSVRKQELLHHPAISNNGGCKAIAQERAL